jgi:hypothetical protein
VDRLSRADGQPRHRHISKADDTPCNRLFADRGRPTATQNARIASTLKQISGLTRRCAAAKIHEAMQKNSLTLAAASLAALLSLAACNSEPETITGGPADPDAQNLAEAPPVELPPALTASRTPRCKDNSLVYIDFFADGTTADLRSEKMGPVTKLTAPAKGEPFVADGYKRTGDGTTVTLEQPGKGSQACKA